MTQHSISLALAGITFLLTVIWGLPLIRILRRWRVSGSPPAGSAHGDALPMGGALFVLPVALLTVLLNFAGTNGLTGVGLSILLPLAALLAYAALGGWMDWRLLRGRLKIGRPTPVFFLTQFGLAVLIVSGLRFILNVPEMYLPFYKGEFDLGFWFFPLAVLVIVGMANAFQATAGVDGLAGLIGATAFAAYGAVAMLHGQVFIARFCFTVVGALLGFLWFNIQPAALQIGRTGTYALGATLAVVALMTGQWPLLAVIAIIPTLEISSIGMQYILDKVSPGRSALRAAPLHTHFLAAGWSRTQIVQRFWLVTLLFAMIGFTLALV